MATLVENATAICSGYNEYRNVIDGSATTINIPKGTTALRNYAYYKATTTSVTFPQSLITIGLSSFQGSGLINLTLPSTIEDVGQSAFSYCQNLVTVNANAEDIRDMVFVGCENLTTITLGNNVKYLSDRLTAGSNSFTTLYIPNSIISIYRGSGIAYNCPNLEYVTIENGFNANGLDLGSSGSTKFSVETIVGWLNALADRTGLTAYTLKIGSANVNKLSEEQIAIATNKNWNLA